MHIEGGRPALGSDRGPPLLTGDLPDPDLAPRFFTDTGMCCNRLAQKGAQSSEDGKDRELLGLGNFHTTTSKERSCRLHPTNHQPLAVGWE